MDAGGCRNERRCPPEETEGLWQHHVMESSSQGGGREEESAPWRLVDVLLSGGAPWGFTLRGGREHREPLLITKVEEASRAAAVSLQVGDELVNINEIPLSGSRQEAICLVKGSHKTLALVVKRRSEPISRPHSWHATKFNESQPETTAKTQSPPAQVWHTRYDASSSSTDLSSGWEQTNLRRVSDQFSSLGSMDSLEHVSPHHPYPPTKSHNNSQEHLDPGGGKRDSAYSSFSTSSGTPDYTLSKSNAASTENMLYKVSQWDSAGQQGGVAKHGGGGARQPGQSLTDGAKQQDDRPGYLHVAGGGGTGGRDSPARADSPQAGSRHSSSSRASCGPVWHVPERKKATSSPSPPPPLPPVRSDSFAATKVVHERGLVIAYPESPETTHVVVYPKAHEKAPEKRTESADNAKRAAESRRSHVPPAKSDTDQFYFTPDSCNQNQFGSNRQYSLSSSDVRLGGQPSQPYSQWHYTSGDQSTLYSQTKTVSVAKPTQNISGYYSSMQELPTAACSTGQLYGPNNQGRNSSNPTAVASSTPAVINQNPDSAAHRYYCVTARQPGGHPLLGKMTEDKKGAAGMEVTQATNDPQTVNKAKYQLPSQQLQQHIKNTNGYGKQEDGLCHKQTPAAGSPAAMPETLLAKPALDDRGGGQRRIHSQNAETPYMSKQPEQRRSLPATLQQQQRELPQEVRRPKQEGGAAQICPRTTPMLHSLSAETADRDAVESLEGGKQVRRADRFATTLRNEIQMRRANLQKSMSAATLTGAEAADPEGNDDDDDVWKSKGGSAPASYKDNLKEAQARVLKATSFRRRDLEPVLLEHPSAESSAPPAYSAALRKDLGSLPTVSESLAGKAGPPPVTRIGGRKRFPAEKKARSFSEPDKIHEVGTTEEATPSENNQRKHFEVAGKPAFPKPPPMQYYYEDPKEANSTVLLGSTGQPEGPASAKGIQCRAVEYGVTEDQSALHSVLHGTQTTTLLEQQRLGTFAEYEARWNVQKKAGETTRASGGRYHSADNILDPGPGEEVTKPSCFHHERSRSSPSADFYRQQKAPAPGRKSAEYSQQEECQAVEQSGSDASSSDRGGVSDCEQPRGEEEEEQLCPLPAEPVEIFPPPMTGPPNPDGSRPPATSVYHRPPSVSHSPPTDLSVPSSEAQAQQPGPPGGKKKKKAPVPLPKPDDSSKRPEVAAAPSDPRTDPPAIAPHRSSVNGGFGSSPGPAHSPETAGGGGDRGHGATNPQPASPPTAPPRSSSSHGPPALPPPPPPPPPPPALAAMDGHRSPSPQFSPQRLSDKPPLSLQDECCNRMDSVMENNDNNNSSAVRKVPIKIVHSESVSEKESRQYLLHSSDDGVVAPPAMECQGGGVPPSPGTTTTAPPRLGGSAEQQDYSVFCAYTRQRDHPQSGDPLLLPPPPDANGDHGNNGSLGLALCQEDQKREELVRDITGKDPSLVDILDQSKMMTTMDLMEGIFPGGQQLLEEAHHHHQHHNHHQRRKAAPKQTPAEDREDDSVSAAMGVVVTSSTYYSTSAPKAEMLIKMKDMQEEEEEDSEDELDVDLANKKQELMDSLSRKLQVLREARESLQEDILDNKALGDEVEATVQALCKPNELDKFRMFVGDLDKVVSLLLSLSGRLARVENALNSPDEDTTPEERRTLTEKRKLLIRQHEDAKELKDNLDRREGVVYDIVASYLDEDGLADYQHFVKMKSALIIEQRKLEDKIKLGDEQLKCLMDSLPLEQRLSL